MSTADTWDAFPLASPAQGSSAGSAAPAPAQGWDAFPLASAAPAQGSSASAPSVSVLEDIENTLPTKLAEGGTTKVVGMPGDMVRLGEYLAGKFNAYFPEHMAAADAEYRRRHPDEPNGPPVLSSMVPGSAAIEQAVRDKTGLELPEPQTKIGKIVGAAGEMLTNPMSYIGPGGLVTKATAAGASGAGSEIAGQATEGTGYEIPARLVAGGLLGAGTAAAAGTKAALPESLAGYNEKAVTKLARDVQDSGLTPERITERAAELGPEATAAEYAPQLAGTAGKVANLPGRGQSVIADAMTARAAERPVRVEDAINQALGPAVDVLERTEQEAAARSAGANPLYQAWRATPVPMTPELEALGPQLRAAGVINGARRDMAIEDAAAAEAAFPRGNIDPANPPPAVAWDYMKRNLDDRIANAQRNGNMNRARQYTLLRNGIVDAIDNHPDSDVAGVWRAARQAYAAPTAIMEARQNGQNLFKSTVRPDEFARDWKTMSAPERQAHIEGVRDALQTMLDRNNRTTSVENFLQAPVARQKLATMIGSDAADALAQAMERERSMAAHEDLVLRNSKTGRMVAGERGLEPEGEGPLTRAAHFYNPEVAPAGVLEMLGVTKLEREARRQGYTQRVRPDVADILTRTGPEAQEALRGLLAYQPQRAASVRQRATTAGLLSADEAANRRNRKPLPTGLLSAPLTGAMAP